MTLIAMIFNDSGEQSFCPSAEIESGEERGKVVDRARKLQSSNLLFCPYCYEKLGKLYPVRFRNVVDKRVHFYHPKHEEARRECKNHSPESEKHKAAKAAIRRRYETQGSPVPTVHEEFLLNSPDKPVRQPDLLITYPDGTSIAIEVQISYINSLELSRRTSDIRVNGHQNVAWYFYGKNYNDENRQWCKDNDVDCYHLWFEDGDESKPRWKKDVQTEKIEKRKSVKDDLKMPSDFCSRLSSENRSLSLTQGNSTYLKSPRSNTGLAISDFSPVYVHPKKPGWFGKLHDRPWGLEDVMIDIDWVICPDRKHKGYPSRYPIKDLIVFDSLEQARLSEIQAS